MGISKAIGRRTRTIAYIERDAFPVANMVAKMEQGLMDEAPIFTDVTSFPYRKFRGLVDIACGGVPCQPHSHAGKRKGGGDERFLFDIFCDGMAEMRPGIIFIENVEGLLSSKMPDGTLCIRYILNKLESIGYCVENSKGNPLVGIFSASEVGAPHQRKRVFILAHDKSKRCELLDYEPGKSWIKKGRYIRGSSEITREIKLWPSRPGERQYYWEPPRVVCQTQPPMGGSTNGPTSRLDFPGCTGLSDTELAEIYEWMEKGTNRVDELRMCGNGVVPQTAAKAWEVLYRELFKGEK